MAATKLSYCMTVIMRLGAITDLTCLGANLHVTGV
jgi:hypothetical protein